MDKDAAVVAELEAERDAFVVQKLLDNDVRFKVAVTTEDAERFYKAEPDRFKPAKDGDTPPFDQVKDQAIRQLETQKTQDMTRAYIEQSCRDANVKLYPDRLTPKPETGS